jgi:hypothetical protein
MIETAVLTRNVRKHSREVPTWSLVVRTDDGRVFDAHVEDLDLTVLAHIIPQGAEVTLSFITTTLRESKS